EALRKLMKSLNAALALLVVTTGGAFTRRAGYQTGLPSPSPPIADIHASSNLLYPRMEGGVVRFGRYELCQTKLLDLIAAAYGVDPDSVLGGPAWLDFDRFDIVAKVPPSSSLEAAKAMLQELLAERFQLAVHRDNKVVQAFALALDKSKSKLKPTDA